MPTNTMEIWQAFVEAQDVITSQYSQPFDIVYNYSTEEGEHHFTYLEKPSGTVVEEIQAVFRGITEDDIHLNRGYFLFPLVFMNHLNSQKLELFREFCDANYYDFIPKPSITGEVRLREDPFKSLSKEFNLNIFPGGEAFATLEQIHAIDNALKTHPTLERTPQIGAISKISASKQLIDHHFQKASRYLREELKLQEFSEMGITKDLIIKNKLIKERHSNWILENTLYGIALQRIVITPHKEALETFLRERKRRRIFFKEEDDPGLSGIILPDLFNNEFHFLCKNNISLADLRFEILFRKKSFEAYLGKGNFQIRHEHVFKIDNQKFIEYIKHSIPYDLFQISGDAETIFFDFNSNKELQTYIAELNKIEDIFYRGLDNSHRYKIRFNYNSPLKNFADTLQEIPSVQTSLVDGGTKLLFRCYFDEANEIPQLKALLVNRLNTLDRYFYEANFDEVEKGRIKYSLYFREEEYYEEAVNQLLFLKGEEILVSETEKQIGILTKVRFPEVVISSDSNTLLFDKDQQVKVYGSLKGEKDKIKRLKDTVSAIFDNNSSIINTNLKELLIDPSIAQTIQGEIVDTKEYSELLQFVEDELLTPREKINDRQIEAVVKSIISSDLFVIQGPPGTGKSTAIAEIIWQHIRNHFRKENAGSYKILVTSETNLAVDNALDKLRSRHHTLIKPIRFGSEDKLDKEGRRFALENLWNWLKTGQDEIREEELANVNIIEDWMQQISQRAGAHADENISPIISDWVKELNNPKEDTRQLFFDLYTEHVNVVGATCSSIGKLSSTGKQTRFFNEYLKIYHPTVSFKESFRQKILFDLVIQDEASKASPPELALPCIYGKKAIVIGDHRQLPPMVDTNEFKENLAYLKNKSKDNKYRRTILGLIKIIDNNRASFEISHFETLFKQIPKNLKTTFNLQYRMHPAINETIKQFYIEEGGLDCGLIVPVDLGVNTPNLNNFASRYHGIEVAGLINSETHVLWLNVDTPEYRKGTSRVNYGEIEAVDYLIERISNSERFKEFVSFWPDALMEEKQIGVITFYGAQAKMLSKLKEKYPLVPLRISPVDRFQGMERNIIIVSTVRSHCIAEFPSQKPDYEKFGEFGYPKQVSLGFAEFPNRLNVALSRAKRLLIIVGNAEHFSQKKVYRNVLAIIKSHPNTRFLNFQDLKN